MNDQKIERVTHTKFLGVFIDENLDWKHHVFQMSNKLSRSIGLLNKTKFVLSKDSLKTLYNSFILPSLIYCNIIWGGACYSTLHRLFMLQKKAVRIINHSKYRDSTGPIFKSLEIITLFDIHKLQIALFMYNAKNKLLPNQSVHFLTFSNAENRYVFRSKSDFCILPYKTKARETFVAVAGPRLWNLLPDKIKNVNSLILFKRELKSWFIYQY